MAGPVLVVELPQATASSEQAAALINACSAALRPGRCELPRDAEQQKATAIAVVSIGSREPLRARVEVGRRREDREVWLSEELAFRGNDASIEQYRSMGLTIAVLFRELSSSGRASSDGDKPSPDRSGAAKAESGAAARREGSGSRSQGDQEHPGTAMEGPYRPRTWLTARGLAGAGAGTGSARFGGEFGVGVAPVHPLVVSLSGRYLRGGLAGVELTFASIGIGAGGSVALTSGLWLRARAEALAENVAAGTRDQETNLNSYDDLWVPGFGVAAELAWSPGGWWGVSVELAGERLARGTTVTLHEQAIGTISPVSFVAGVGLEVYPLRP